MAFGVPFIGRPRKELVPNCVYNSDVGECNETIENELFKAVRLALYARCIGGGRLRCHCSLRRTRRRPEQSAARNHHRDGFEHPPRRYRNVQPGHHHRSRRDPEDRQADAGRSGPAAAGGHRPATSIRRSTTAAARGSSSIGLRGLGSPRTLVLINGHRYLSRRSELDPGQHDRAHRSPDRRCVFGVRLGCGRGRRQLHPAQRLPGRRVLAELRHLGQGRRRDARATSSRSARAPTRARSWPASTTTRPNRSWPATAISRRTPYRSTATPVRRGGGYSSSAARSNPAPRPRAAAGPILRSIFGASDSSAHQSRRDRPDVDNDQLSLLQPTRATSTTTRPSTWCMTPQERTASFFNGNYKLTDNVEVYLDGCTTRRPRRSSWRRRSIDAPAAWHISADSYYNPFGVEFARDGAIAISACALTAAVRARRTSARHRPGPDRLQGFLRRSATRVELGCRLGLRPSQLNTIQRPACRISPRSIATRPVASRSDTAS